MTQQDKKPWTVLALLNWTKEYFTENNLSDARVNAEMLLAHILSCQRIELYAKFDSIPDKNDLERFRDLVRRAAKSEPAAYLIGTKEFFSLEFKVTSDVLIPRSETEILVAEALRHLESLNKPSQCWDVCTGSGCVAIAIAANKTNATILASDISIQAIAIAQENACKHNLAEQIRFRECDLLNLPDDCDDLGLFDVITANPPYVATNDEIAPCVKHEPRSALFAGDDGMDMLIPIIQTAPKYLKAGGALILEFGAGQADAVRDLIIKAGLSEPKIIRDYQSIERATVAIKS